MKNKTYLYNLIFPAFIYGIVSGTIVGIAIVFFKFCAAHIIAWSGKGYDFLRLHPIWCFPVIMILFGAAWLSAKMYDKHPNVRGGGIPTSIGILRGLISFHWLKNAIRVFCASLATFFIGVPLGNEGPSVQIGTALGRGITRIFARKNQAWDRYIMTSGACAGFTAATDAPISGMMFAVEEAHQRISPMIILVATISVTFSKISSEIISPLLGVSEELFEPMELPEVSLPQLWLPFLIGIVVGLFSVVFLKYYTLLNQFWTKKLAKIPNKWKIFAVFLMTLGMGLVSYRFISTGHALIETLMNGYVIWYFLLICLILRATIMIFASSSGITGGMFLPIMTLGAIISSLLGGLIIHSSPLTAEYYSVVVVLGISACIAGMMKTPLTALVFSMEALSAQNNILPVLLTVVISYFITELFGVESINEHVLKNRIQELRREKEPIVIDTFVTVQASSFAVGKQIRDIFWPCNLFVLSVKHAAQVGAEVDERGDKTLRADDILHVRFSTYTEAETRAELFAIVGEQEFEGHMVHHV